MRHLIVVLLILQGHVLKPSRSLAQGLLFYGFKRFVICDDLHLPSICKMVKLFSTKSYGKGLFLDLRVVLLRLTEGPGGISERLAILQEYRNQCRIQRHRSLVQVLFGGHIWIV